MAVNNALKVYDIIPTDRYQGLGKYMCTCLAADGAFTVP